jgi:hypothetical protein
MMNKFSARWLLIAALMLTVSVGQTVAQNEVSIPVPPTPVLQGTPEPLVELLNGLHIENQHTSELLDEPKLSIEVDKPILTGAEGEVVDNFNALVDQIIEDTAGSFKDEVIQYATDPADLPPEIADLGSFIGVSYRIFNPTESVLSLWFGVNWYSAGAAHPNSYSRTLNYDLATGTQLTLADLFQPDSTYLETLSAYAIQELTTRGTLFFPEGAEPTDINYQNWNILPEGLLITFDDYQVAPHAAGPQQFTVPYLELVDIIDPDGVLGPLATRG